MAVSPVTPQNFQDLIPDPSSSKCSAFALALLQLPVTLYKLVKWLLTSDGKVSIDFKRGVMPPGTYEFAAAELPLDGSRLKCDGSAVSRETYADLFAAIGEVYGAGDMSTTFNLPDFRDRFPIGQSATKTTGDTGGEATHLLTDGGLTLPDGAQFVTQNWAIGTQNVGGGDQGDEPYSRVDADAIFGEATSTGGDVPLPLMPPWLACFVYIRA